jgi:hypothetical protein
MISIRAITALLLIAVLVIVASPATAQYMFLDTNGDGAFTSADHLVAGSQTVNVYLNTNHNRDGSLAVCDRDGSSPLNINSYVINLSGTNVTYSGFTNDMGGAFSTNFGEINAGDGRYKNGFGARDPLPAGLYKLAHLTVTATAGALLSIVDMIPASSDFTSFGTGGGCFGNDFDNTYKLVGPNGGSDWTDVDGLVPPSEVGPPVLAAIGNKTVDEGNCLAFTATAAAPNGNPVTFFLSSGPPIGASITAAGQFTWCPTDDQGPGVHAVTVCIVDNVTQLTDCETIQVTVNDVNMAPVITAIGDKTVAIPNSILFLVTATDADVPANSLSFSLDPGAPAGASISASGIFSWVPSVPGLYPVTVRVTDNGSPPLSDAESFTITVLRGDTAPVVQNPGNLTVQAGGTLDRTVTATDADNLPLTFSKTAESPAFMTVTTTSPTSANIHLAPTVNDAGFRGGGVLASNGSTTGLALFTIIVKPASGVLLNPIPPQHVNEEVCLNFTVLALTSDGEPASFSLGAGAPNGASITPSGQFSWCPTEAQGDGFYPVTICATEASSGLTDCRQTTISVFEVNRAPVLNPIGNKAGTVGVPVTFTATGTDADLPANSLTFRIGGGSAVGATIDPATGAFRYTPTSCGAVTVTIVVDDNGSPILSDSETITISTGCTSPPVLNPIGSKTAQEQVLLTFTATAVMSSGGLATFSLSGPVPPGASITSGGTFRWTPAESQGGRDWSVTICVTESTTGLQDCETITITVPEDNLAPVLSAIGNKEVCVGHLLAFTAVATDPDIPANALTFSLDQGAPAGATITPGGAFSWTPSIFGVFQVTIRVTDNGTPPLSDSEALAISVSQFGCTGLPSIQPISDMTVNEGDVAEQTVLGSDTANLALTFGKGSGPLFMTVATTSPTTGKILLTPGFADAGSYTATVYATNGTFTAASNFQITVVNVCRPPAADAGGPYAGVTGNPVALNGAGSADPDGDALTYAWSFGDGNTGSGVAPIHVYAASGTYTVSLEVTDGCGSDTDVTTASIADCLTAYFEGTGNKFVTFDLNSGKPTECIQLEPVLGSFAIEEVDLASIVMRSPNSGSIGEIHAVATKNALGGDRNNNFVEEISVCFAKEDLRGLFSKVTATNGVNVTLEGRLVNGARFCANETVNVRAARGGGNLVATISPNPLNPSAVLTFATQERGLVLVQLFDVRGRLVRTLRDESDAAAGYHDVRIDGTSADGTRLGSGVYYLRIRAGGVEERKAITILK